MINTSEAIDELAVLKRVFIELKETRAKLAAMERAATEPIAIIGMGCRFPGGANNPEAFWRLLRDGRNAVTETPPERWTIDPHHYQDLDAHSRACIRYGGFLDQVDAFDSQFFRISADEAIKMDPQHRLLLEVSWEALEHAGQDPEKLTGSRTGVFLGITTNDYLHLQVQSSSFTDLDAFTTVGNSLNFAAGRLSYNLGLHGPCFAMDAACASSLLSVHLACQSLRTGECELALAGGANLILSPYRTIVVSKTRELSPDGSCKTFDAAANGFVRGEGCGMVVLKRLSAAEANGDTILALIRGSAINHNGPSSGFTVPNGLAQQALIREALLRAGVQPGQIGYVEAHGTGTSFGDPIEVRALGETLCENRPKDQPLPIGSVKTNIGHLEAAAGIASLLKVVLSLQHEEIPPHLHFKTPHPNIDWETLPVVVPTERRAWPAGNGRRIAGVSAFGMNGTIAHMVVEEAPIREVALQVESPLSLLTLSARDEKALRQLAEAYACHLRENPSDSLADICFTANTGRAHFPHRLAVVAAHRAEMLEQLTTFVIGKERAGVKHSGLTRLSRPPLTFLYPGESSRYAQMGRELFEAQLTFRSILQECDALLRPHLAQPLLAVLYGEERELLDETAYAQPALFAVEYALSELWSSWGVMPDAVLGQSVGEYVAACVAGVFTLAEGLKLIAARGRLMQKVIRADVIRPPSLEEMLDEFEQLAGQISYAAPQTPMVSTVTGAAIGPEIQQTSYWRREALDAVQSAKGLSTLRQQGCELYLEVGPGATLSEQRSSPAADETVCLSSMRRGREWQQMLETLGELYVLGMEVNWTAVEGGSKRRRLSLPTYPFQREAFWIGRPKPQLKAVS